MPDIENSRIKNMQLAVTVACHKGYMQLDRKIHPGLTGNRRDCLTAYIDRLLNLNDVFGIGRLSLRSVRTVLGLQNFTGREIVYEIPDFNYRSGVR